MSDKKTTIHDGLEALGKITGLGREGMNKVWLEVKANIAKLDSCAGPHDFSQDDPSDLRSKCTCSKCGGKISRSDCRWYELGLKHARENSLD